MVKDGRSKVTKAAGKPAITMDDIARLANVSKATVSRALDGNPLVKPATMERINAIVRKHGYTVNRNAQKLWKKRTNTIAVVMHIPPSSGKSISAAFLFQLLADVAQSLAIRHQDMLLCPPSAEEPEAYQDILASKKADGLIFLGQGEGSKWLEELARSQAPFVVWGTPSATRTYCSVGSDNFKGGYLVGQRFAQLKRRRILFVGNRKHVELEQRRAGMEEATRACQPKMEIGDLEIPDFSYETSYAVFKGWLAAKNALPDAIFAISDMVAVGIIAALKEAGIRIPEDVSVIGYNDTPYAAHLSPALTTIHQDTREAGSLLVEKLFQILDGARPPSVTLPTDLVIRES